MIVVDTSVWIDVLNGVDSPPAMTCVGLIEDGRPVALTDIVFAEILQGLRSDDEAQMVERHLRAFPILRLDSLEDFSLAADLYRTARAQGITVRKTLDCLIAAACIQAGAPLLHADADFDRLATCTALRIFEL
jgi:predicted nucleic acid-binding protein